MPVVDLEIRSREPYAAGQEFGETGAYEKIDGLATFAVDPANEANRLIVDLDLAPKDSDANVRFRSDFSLLIPQAKDRGNGRLLSVLVNRGRKLTGRLNRAPAQPLDAPGDGFLFRRGWSVLSLGWQWDVLRDSTLLGFDPPPVLENGLPVSGPNIVEIRPNYRESTFVLANRVHQPYPAARLDDPEAALIVRDYEDGEATSIPRDQWRFARETADGTILPSREHVYMESGFEPGKCYYLTYQAEAAKVVGTSLLAFRDIATFLRNPSDVSPGFERVFGFGISQTGRMLRHFLHLGLNLDQTRQQAYDGLLVHVAGGRRGEFNHRFAQPSVQPTAGFGHLFPFADDEAIDPFSEKKDGLLKRQREIGGMPKVFYTNTSAEYWRGDGALAHTDASGESDLEDPPETRTYHFAGTQHVAGALPQVDRNLTEGSRGRYGFNLIDYTPLLRSALVNLDLWVSDGVEPPASKHPRLADGTLVSPQETLEIMRRLPGLETPDPDRLWRLREVDLGPGANLGIGRYPVKEGRAYPVLIPAVNDDGNELGGIRLPDLSVPVATHAGWNLRHPETGAPEQIISMMGFTNFFPATSEQRERTSDPRQSIAERYPTKAAFLDRVREKALRLAAERYIADEDVEVLVGDSSARYDAAVKAPEPAPAGRS